MPEARITVSRPLLEEALRCAREIATQDKSPGLPYSADAYAHALGKCNGNAKMLVIALEVAMEHAG